MSDLHFAADPEDIRCGLFDVKTLCGELHNNTTNWNVERVTCQRCLEVMEEKAAGVETVKAAQGEIMNGLPSTVVTGVPSSTHFVPGM